MSEQLPEDIKALGNGMVDNDDFNELLDKQQTFIRKYFEEHENEKGFVPMLAIVGRKVNAKEKRINQQIGIAPLLVDGFDDWRVRRKIVRELGELYAKDNIDMEMKPVAVFLLSEAWIKKVAKEDYEEFEKEGKSPSEYEDKVEVVMASGFTLDGRVNYVAMRMVRDTDDIIMGLPLYQRQYYKDEVGGSRDMKDMHDNILMEFFRGYAHGILANVGDMSDDNKAAILEAAKKAKKLHDEQDKKGSS